MPKPTADLLRAAVADSDRAYRRLLVVGTAARRASYEGGPTHYADTVMWALDQIGWSFAEIGQEVGLTRKRVYERVARCQARPPYRGPLPDLPLPPRPRMTHFAPAPVLRIPPREAVELRALAVVARNHRHSQPDDHPARVAARELLQREWSLHQAGVPLYDVARALGTTYSAVYYRLKRAGYQPMPGGPRRALRRPLPPAVQDRILRLLTAGSGNRYWLTPHHPARRASDDLGALLSGLLDDGYVVADIAASKVLDTREVTRRVARHRQRIHTEQLRAS
jgi:hypothetical protein